MEAGKKEGGVAEVPGVEEEGDAVVMSLRAGVLLLAAGTAGDEAGAGAEGALLLLLLVTATPPLEVTVTVFVAAAVVEVDVSVEDEDEVEVEVVPPPLPLAPAPAPPEAAAPRFTKGELRLLSSDLLGDVLMGVSGVSKSGSKGSLIGSLSSFVRAARWAS